MEPGRGLLVRTPFGCFVQHRLYPRAQADSHPWPEFEAGARENPANRSRPEAPSVFVQQETHDMNVSNTSNPTSFHRRPVQALTALYCLAHRETLLEHEADRDRDVSRSPKAWERIRAAAFEGRAGDIPIAHEIGFTGMRSRVSLSHDQAPAPERHTGQSREQEKGRKNQFTAAGEMSSKEAIPLIRQF